MNNDEKKQALQDLLSTADEGLTNVLMEAVEAYQKKVQEEFIVPEEWIEEFDKRSENLALGITKPCDPYETIEIAKQQLAELRKQRNHAL
ncbi:MAG: hypothetical protein MUE72_01015 [Chitinophagaceae bacterium]|jgi:hypothetical protein|nr:hypothetical protein [Chitinophagaceae bacterium]